MARPQRVSETQILEAARQTFLEHGAKAPLSTIAKRLGVSTAALLHRTGSKEALLRRSLAPPLSGVLASLRAGPKKGSERSQLERLLLELNEFLSQAIPSLVEYVELSGRADFNDAFIEVLAFPPLAELALQPAAPAL